MIIHSEAQGNSAHSDLAKNDYDFSSRYSVIETWPQFQRHCPSDTPSNVENFYNQGLENLASRRWDAAGAMFRKSLDVATKQLRPDLKSKNLYNRIEAMVEDGDLTAAMGQWSHRIRLDGNDAVHDEEPETEEDANSTQRFAEAFLTYGYTLPALVTANNEDASTKTAFLLGSIAPIPHRRACLPRFSR